MPNTVHNRHLNVPLQFTPRKFRRMFKRGGIPMYLRAGGGLPTPPASFNWSKDHTLQFPMNGNGPDSTVAPGFQGAGDCVEADGAHLFGAMTGCATGREVLFTGKQVIDIYSKLTGYVIGNPNSDQGTDPDQFFNWLKTTSQGYPGGYKILDDFVINYHDKAGAAQFMYLFGPLSIGGSLPNSWIQEAAPGATWDTATPNPMNGHEWLLSGREPGTWDTETWAIDPPIHLTDAGMDSCQPVLTVCFSLSWFNAQGIAPNGLSYDVLAAYWHQMGGIVLPPNPFTGPPAPGPTPPPSPTPVNPLFKLTVPRLIPAHRKVSFLAPVDIPAGKYDVTPAVAGSLGYDAWCSEDYPVNPNALPPVGSSLWSWLRWLEQQVVVNVPQSVVVAAINASSLATWEKNVLLLIVAQLYAQKGG